MLPDLKSGPNISLLCAVDYNALQFYDIILAPFAVSIWLASILRADSGKIVIPLPSLSQYIVL